MIRILFQLVLSLTLFSLWAGFALLVVNPFFYKELPGYTIGRICVWEFVAVVIAGIIGQLMILKWGSLKIEKVGQERKLTLNPKYGVYFISYFLIAVITGIWQFWLFSQNF